MMTFLKSWRMAIGLAVLISAGGAWYLFSLDARSTPSGLLRAKDAAVVATGQRIYADICAACHGDNLQGQDNWQTRDSDGYLPAPPHDETGHTWHHADQLLFDLTKLGIQKFAGGDYKTKMPAYEGILSDDEIVAVLSYIKSQWPEEIRMRHDQINIPTE